MVYFSKFNAANQNYAAMKKICFLLKVVGIVFFLPISLASFAQLPVYVNGGLDGENIISTGYFPWNGEVQATSTTIYAKSVTKGSVVTSADTSFERIWSAPPPRKIDHIYVKLQVVRDSSGKFLFEKQSDKYLMVVMDNGDVYELNVDHYDNAVGGIDVANETYWDHAGSGGSEAYNKLLGDALYLLSSSHLYVSPDSTGWHIDSTGLNNAHVYDVAIDTAQRVYVATDNGLFMQDTTAGSTFASVAAYTGPKGLESVFVDRKNRIIVSLNSGGVYFSEDGTAWALDTAGIGTQFVKSFGADAYSNLYAVVSNTFTGVDHLYKSVSGTQAWQLTDTSVYNKTVNPIGINAFVGHGILLLTTQFGTFISGDTGRTWIPHTKGIRSENITGIAKLPTGQLLLTNALGIYKGTGSTAWAKSYPQSGFKDKLPLYDDRLGNIYTIDNSVINNFQLGGVIFKSPDGGNTWAADTAGLGNVGGTLFFVDEKGAQHIGNSLYGGSYPCRLWTKPKNGAWGIDTSGFPVAAYNFVSGFASDDKGYLYVTGYFSSKIMRRPVGGGNWVADSAGISSSVFYFSKIAGGKGDIIGTTENGLYHRGSGTWSNIPLPAQALSPSIGAIAIDTSGYIFAAIKAVSGAGVYFTSDLGVHWKFAGLDSMDVSSLVSYGDSTYVLTYNHGALVLTHNSALPVALSALQAYQLGKGIQVQWSGYNEVNMNGYDVERSANGNQFTKLGNITAKGSSVTENKYSYFDASPLSGDNFYRIKAIGKDGTYQYSGIVKVTINALSDMLVYPNPVQSKTINVQLNNIETGNYSLVVYSSTGQRLYARTVNHPGGSASIAINAHNMAKGLYWVLLKGNKQTFRKMILVQ